MSDETERLLRQQVELLQQLVDQLCGSERMGFGASPHVRPEYIYANRTRGGLWYTLDDKREVVMIDHPALTCTLEKLDFEQVERRGKNIWKLHLHVRAGGQSYIIEAGHDSSFSKGLMSALAVMTPAQIASPVTIEAQAGDSPEVLFCRVYSGGELVFAPYDGSTNWKTVAARARLAVNGEEKPAEGESAA